MSLDKFLRLTIRLDVEPESVNLKDTLDYLKNLNGAEHIELLDVEVIGDPAAVEKQHRIGLEKAFSKESIEGPPPVAPFLAPAKKDEVEELQEEENEPVNILDRIRLR